MRIKKRFCLWKSAVGGCHFGYCGEFHSISVQMRSRSHHVTNRLGLGMLWSDLGPPWLQLGGENGRCFDWGKPWFWCIFDSNQQSFYRWKLMKTLRLQHVFSARLVVSFHAKRWSTWIWRWFHPTHENHGCVCCSWVNYSSFTRSHPPKR